MDLLANEKSHEDIVLPIVLYTLSNMVSVGVTLEEQMPTKLPPETYLEIWERASAEEIGLCVNVVPEDQTKLINALYECRQTFGGFEDMMIFQPKPDGTLFIAHKTVELPE